MSAPSLSLFEYLRMRLRLSSPAEAERVRQALWMGVSPPLGASALVLALQSLVCLLALVALTASLLPLHRLAREIRGEYLQALDQVLPASTASTPARLGLPHRGQEPDGLPPGSREHRAVVELLFARETRQTIQKHHDLWQDLYGDKAYRGALKPLAAGHAARAYLGDLLSGRAGSPVAWTRNLSPEDLERFTRKAERDFRTGASSRE